MEKISRKGAGLIKYILIRVADSVIPDCYDKNSVRERTKK